MRRPLFICMMIKDGDVFEKTIDAPSSNEAKGLFFKEFSAHPSKIIGPFYKVREKKIKKKIISKQEMKFSKVTKKAMYKDWQVTAFILEKPENQAYLIFNKNTADIGSKSPRSISVPIEDLRFL